MERNVLARIGLSIGTVLLTLAGSLAHAKPGIDHQFRTPHYADETLQMNAVDLQVQALGGPISIERTWKKGKWVWNDRWSDLAVKGAAEPGKDNSGRPYAVAVAGKNYVRAGGVSMAEKEDEDIVLSNLPYRTLIAFKRGLNGYRWQDLYGNRNDYDPQGRLTQYVFYNGIKVSLARDAQQRLSAVKDHLGATLVTFTYTGDNLTSIRDYSGREVKYEYTGNLLTAVVDVLGQRWQYHYAGSTLAGYTDPLKQRTTLSLSGDKLREHRRPDGRWTRYSFGYDNQTEQHYLREQDQSGLVTERWYDQLGHVVRNQINGELQFTRTYELSDNSSDVRKVTDFFAASRVGSSGGGGVVMAEKVEPPEPPYVIRRTEVDAEERRTVTEYNRYQQITRIQYPDGNSISRSYDPKTRRLAEEINERGIKTQYRYDGNGNRSQIIEAAGLPEQRVTTYRYDSLNRLVEELQPGGGVTPDALWQYRYDDKGNRTKVIDPLNYETTYTHDVMGNVLTLTNALGKTWTSTYDAVGNLTSLTTPLEQTLTYHYDALGRRTKNIAPNNAELSIEYNVANLPKTITDATGARTNYEYDANQRLIEIIDPLGNSQKRNYDSYGRLRLEEDAAGNQTLYRHDDGYLSGIDYPSYVEYFKYDNRRRVKEIKKEYKVNALDQKGAREFRYLATGGLEQWIDEASNAVSNKYNAHGQLVESLDAAGGATKIAYDARGNLVQVLDPAGRVTQYKYDARDLIVAETKLGDAGAPKLEWRYIYNAQGYLQQTVTPEGKVSLFTYDDANRLIGLQHFIDFDSFESGAAENFTKYVYTEAGQLKSYEDKDSKAIYQYDTLGQLVNTAVTYKVAGADFSKSFSYTYDASGRKQSYTNPEQQTYIYRYTAHGQLAGVTIPGEGSISFQDFNWLQPQQVLYPGGSALQIVYDGLLRYTNRTLKDPAGNLIQSHSYDYDPVSNITAIETQGGKTEYGYDKLYRLTEAKYPEGDSRTNEAYAYDGVGNRLDEATKKEELDISQWQYNAHNQLVSHDGIGYRYNADGHLIEKGALQADQSLKQSGEIDHWVYRYDSRERLIEVYKNGLLIVEYSYNPIGQRIRKHVPQKNVTTYYLYNQEGLVAEYDERGGLQQEYAFAPGAPWMSRPLFTRAQRRDNGQWTVSYYGTGHLGAPEVAFNRGGELTWRAKVAAFGEAKIDLDIINNPIRYSGQYFDSETGLHYNFFRDYSASLGRFLQRDPIGLRGGLNDYGYAYQNPIINMDPDGRFVMLGIPLYMWIAGAGATAAGVTCIATNCGQAVYNAAAEANEAHEERERRKEEKKREKALAKARSAERNAYSPICKIKSAREEGETDCDYLRKELKRMQNCYAMRLAFKMKWYPDDESHWEEIRNTGRAVDKLIEQVTKCEEDEALECDE